MEIAELIPYLYQMRQDLDTTLVHAPTPGEVREFLKTTPLTDAWHRCDGTVAIGRSAFESLSTLYPVPDAAVTVTEITGPGVITSPLRWLGYGWATGQGDFIYQDYPSGDWKKETISEAGSTLLFAVPDLHEQGYNPWALCSDGSRFTFKNKDGGTWNTTPSDSADQVFSIPQDQGVPYIPFSSDSYDTIRFITDDGQGRSRIWRVTHLGNSEGSPTFTVGYQGVVSTQGPNRWVNPRQPFMGTNGSTLMAGDWGDALHGGHTVHCSYADQLNNDFSRLTDFFGFISDDNHENTPKLTALVGVDGVALIYPRLFVNIDTFNNSHLGIGDLRFAKVNYPRFYNNGNFQAAAYGFDMPLGWGQGWSNTIGSRFLCILGSAYDEDSGQDRPAAYVGYGLRSWKTVDLRTAAPADAQFNVNGMIAWANGVPMGNAMVFPAWIPSQNRYRWYQFVLDPNTFGSVTLPLMNATDPTLERRVYLGDPLPFSAPDYFQNGGDPG